MMIRDIHVKICQVVVTIFFLMCIYTGLIATVLQYNPNPAGVEEKRSTAVFPDIKEQGTAAYISSFEGYIADNYGMRNILITMYARFRHHLLNVYSYENRILDFFNAE